MTIRQIAAALGLLILAFGVAGCPTTPPDPFIGTWTSTNPSMTFVVRSKVYDGATGAIYSGSVTFPVSGLTVQVTGSGLNQIIATKDALGTLYSIMVWSGTDNSLIFLGTLSGSKLTGELAYTVGGVSYPNSTAVFTR